MADNSKNVVIQLQGGQRSGTVYPQRFYVDGPQGQIVRLPAATSLETTPSAMVNSAIRDATLYFDE